MSNFLLILFIAALLAFIVITAIKAWRYSHYPVHSRLELYPVPKEGKVRAEYGGSYLEEPEWWKKPRTIDTVNETKDILGEMLFIKKLFVHQRSLWWASEAFHLGIYAMAAWTVLLLLATIWPVTALIVLASIAGIVGFTLATVGAIALLARRIFSPTLSKYTTPQEYFNISLILFVLVTGIICWTLVASPFQVASDLLYMTGAPMPALVVVHIIALCVMFVYIPLSKMSHYVGKFFAFHKVLWDNDPNTQGSEVNERLRAAKPPKTTWSAPHVNPNVKPDDSTE